MKKPLCADNLSPTRKIFIERPEDGRKNNNKESEILSKIIQKQEQYNKWSDTVIKAKQQYEKKLKNNTGKQTIMLTKQRKLKSKLNM